MVLITEEEKKDLKVRENGVAGGVELAKTGEHGDNKVATDTPRMSISKADDDGAESEISEGDDCEETEVDYTRNYWEDEDDIYQEFEELDFEALPDRSDTRSIASDDSFYPPDNSVISHMCRPPSPDSPEPISFFKACCNNNSIIVKIMIRQGVAEEEVKETDRNRRVGVSVLSFFMKHVLVMHLCVFGFGFSFDNLKPERSTHVFFSPQFNFSDTNLELQSVDVDYRSSRSWWSRELK